MRKASRAITILTCKNEHGQTEYFTPSGVPVKFEFTEIGSKELLKFKFMEKIRKCAIKERKERNRPADKWKQKIHARLRCSIRRAAYYSKTEEPHDLTVLSFKEASNKAMKHCLQVKSRSTDDRWKRLCESRANSSIKRWKLKAKVYGIES